MKEEKEEAMRFVDSLARLVDRYAVVDLEKNRYEYHELVSDTLLYPETGVYQDLIDRFFPKICCADQYRKRKGGPAHLTGLSAEGAPQRI